MGYVRQEIWKWVGAIALMVPGQIMLQIGYLHTPSDLWKVCFVSLGSAMLIMAGGVLK